MGLRGCRVLRCRAGGDRGECFGQFGAVGGVGVELRNGDFGEAAGAVVLDFPLLVVFGKDRAGEAPERFGVGKTRTTSARRSTSRLRRSRGLVDHRFFQCMRGKSVNAVMSGPASRPRTPRPGWICFWRSIRPRRGDECAGNGLRDGVHRRTVYHLQDGMHRRAV